MVIVVKCDKCKKELYEVEIKAADCISFRGYKKYCDECSNSTVENEERILE